MNLKKTDRGYAEEKTTNRMKKHEESLRTAPPTTKEMTKNM